LTFWPDCARFEWSTESSSVAPSLILTVFFFFFFFFADA
jgi:hypothetical protein